MTYPPTGPISTSPAGPYPPGPPQFGPPPKKKSKTPWIVGGAVVGVLVGCLALGVIIANAPAPDGGGETVRTPGATAAQAQATTRAAPTTAAASPPKPADFSLRVVTLTKKCFGSAGCNVSFRIEVSYSGPTLSSSRTYRVLYTITGGEDGAQQNSFELTGTQYSVDSEEFIQTKSSNTTLTAAVTEVLNG